MFFVNILCYLSDGYMPQRSTNLIEKLVSPLKLLNLLIFCCQDHVDASVWQCTISFVLNYQLYDIIHVLISDYIYIVDTNDSQK